MKKTLLVHARVVFPKETRNAAILLQDGLIAAIDPIGTSGADVVDLSGRLLIPGMIDLHCDALEKEVEPRPGVYFPLDFACAQADRRNATAGITTVFHAISFANHELGVRNNAFAAEIVRAVHALKPYSLVDNRVHARYELTDETGPQVLNGLIAKGLVHLVSFMDHSPGQGQFRDVEAYRGYLARTYQTDEASLDRILDRKLKAAEGALQRMEELAALVREKGIAIASHDDSTPEKVAMVAGLGASISEFPVNLDAARAAHDRGLSTIFGAPNILRGRSQSGNMRAIDAVMEGVADCLCSDYSPAALLPSVLRLPDLAGIPIDKAVALVTSNPARAAGLDDRGRIEPGKRADLVAIRFLGGLPQAEMVWSAGRLVVSVRFR